MLFPSRPLTLLFKLRLTESLKLNSLFLSFLPFFSSLSISPFFTSNFCLFVLDKDRLFLIPQFYHALSKLSFIASFSLFLPLISVIVIYPLSFFWFNIDYWLTGAEFRKPNRAILSSSGLFIYHNGCHLF